MKPIDVIDGDGHVIEEGEGIRQFLPPKWRENIATRALGLFPTLDHMHHALSTSPDGAFINPGTSGWKRFLDEVDLKRTVLFPTAGLVVGRIVDLDYVIGLTRAYNDWLHQTYLKADPRFRGMALLPMQEPTAAVEELHRAVTELGMCGAMISSNGLGSHLGAKRFWPVYEAAAKLKCPLAIHGGNHANMGFDDLNVFAAVHALGHPFGVLITFASFVSNAIFERFPGLRVAFMESGTAWLMFILERLSGSFEGFIPFDPRGEYLQLKEGETVADRVQQYILQRRIFVGIEGDEPTLTEAVKRFGSEAFFFSSDFPHEVNVAKCRDRVRLLKDSPQLTPVDRERILRDNARLLYGLS